MTRVVYFVAGFSACQALYSVDVFDRPARAVPLVGLAVTLLALDAVRERVAAGEPSGLAVTLRRWLHIAWAGWSA